MNNYEQATALLASPLAKLSNRARKDLHRARLAFAYEKPPVLEVVQSRASIRRVERAANSVPAPKPASKQAPEVRLANTMRRKNFRQLCNTLRRGNSRSVAFAIKAAVCFDPRQRQLFSALGFTYQMEANAAQKEIDHRHCYP